MDYEGNHRGLGGRGETECFYITWNAGLRTEWNKGIRVEEGSRRGVFHTLGEMIGGSDPVNREKGLDFAYTLRTELIGAPDQLGVAYERKRSRG